MDNDVLYHRFINSRQPRKTNGNGADNKLETPTKGFTKFDKGKPKVSLVDPLYLLGVAEVMTQGASVYGEDNWKLCEEPTRYLDALLRHTIKYWSGEKIDRDSGKSHLYHIGFNAMALDYFDSKLKD